MAASVEKGLNNSASIPPLENGDHLTRHEFERRYTAMHGSLVTSSLVRETTESESLNYGYKFGQEQETYSD